MCIRLNFSANSHKYSQMENIDPNYCISGYRYIYIYSSAGNQRISVAFPFSVLFGLLD